MCNHEIDNIRGDFFTRYDKITFIFSIFIIDNYHYFSLPNRFDSFVYSIEHCVII